MAKRLTGLGMIGRLGKSRASSSTMAPPAAKPATSKQVLPGRRGPSSSRQAPVDMPDSTAPPAMAPPAGTQPPTFQQTYQQQQAQQAQQPQDFSSLLEFSQQYKPANMIDRLITSQGEKNIKAETEKLLGAGDIAGAQALWEKNKSNWWTKDYANAMIKQFGSTPAAGAGGSVGGPGATGGGTGGLPGGDQNPFLTGQVSQTFGPQVGQIGEQMMTQAGQQLQSEQAIRGQAGRLEESITGTQQRAGERIEGLQEEGRGMHTQFTRERQALSQRVADLPRQIEQRFDVAIDDFTNRVAQSQGIIDTKEAAAMAGVMQGKNAAISAAVQGIQGNVSTTIAQIQSNPNLTDSQKQMMIAQTRMQGASQMAPAVGQTILQFNNLAAQTAVSFGNMTTQIQQTGLMGTAELMGKKASVFADTSIAAANLGANLLSTQQSADSNYLSTQAQLESTRSTIEMSGDQLRAQLLPEMGIPYADYATPMIADLQMNFDLSKQEFSAIMGRNQFEIMAWMAQQQARGANAQMFASMAQMVGGPAGAALGFLPLLAAGGTGTQPPSLPGTTAVNPWRL